MPKNYSHILVSSILYILVICFNITLAKDVSIADSELNQENPNKIEQNNESIIVETEDGKVSQYSIESTKQPEPETAREWATRIAREGKRKRLQEAIKDEPWFTVADDAEGNPHIKVRDTPEAKAAYAESLKKEQARKVANTTKNSTSPYKQESQKEGTGFTGHIIRLFRVRSLSDFLYLVFVIGLAIVILNFVDNLRKKKN